MMNADLQQRFRDERIAAVLIIENPAHAAPLVGALREGGIHCVELTLRTPAALEVLREMRAMAPDFLLGAGTVLTPQQIAEVKEVGADFAVAPGCNPKVVAAARDAGLFFAPGIATPTDIEMALQEECRVLKFFPAETSGGLAHLESMAAPYRHLGLQFIPLGGINPGNLAIYLASPLIAAVGGSWIAPQNLIRDGDWTGISRRAAEARSIASSC